MHSKNNCYENNEKWYQEYYYDKYSSKNSHIYESESDYLSQNYQQDENYCYYMVDDPCKEANILNENYSFYVDHNGNYFKKKDENENLNQQNAYIIQNKNLFDKNNADYMKNNIDTHQNYDWNKEFDWLGCHEKIYYPNDTI